MSLLALLWLSACGGRSVAHVGATEDGENDGGGGTSALQGCASLCQSCDLDDLVPAGSCSAFCTDVQHQAGAADCQDALDDFIRCRNKRADQCSLESCPNETNNLTVCVLTFCDEHSVSAPALCSPW
jgi:hypothetical protein